MADDLTQRKRTMIKSRVGCVKTSTYNLPASSHVYGYKQPSDPEGAGALISTWVTANPSSHVESNKIIVYSNVLAVKNGCLTSKAMRQYFKDHPSVRLRETLNDENSNTETHYEGPFGIKTKFAEEPMESIVQARYTNFATDDQDYPNTAFVAAKGPMSRPKSTIASDSVALARETSREKELNQKKRFTMKKFQNVEGIALKVLKWDAITTGNSSNYGERETEGGGGREESDCRSEEKE